MVSLYIPFCFLIQLTKAFIYFLCLMYTLCFLFLFRNISASGLFHGKKLIFSTSRQSGHHSCPFKNVKIDLTIHMIFKKTYDLKKLFTRIYNFKLFSFQKKQIAHNYEIKKLLGKSFIFKNI
jgi:hypothetical protein